MRVTKKQIGKIQVTAYNDSNIEWVVSSKGFSTQRFAKNKWTMKDAISFYCELNHIGD